MPETAKRATPEAELRELRERRKARRSAFREFWRRTGRQIADLKGLLKVSDRLKEAGVRDASAVLAEADRASRHVDIHRDEFRAACLVILKRETGIPQKNIYGCDWGERQGRPYCHQPVTPANAGPYIRWVLEAPYANRMNGMSWTQTTWWEKLERVLKLGDPSEPWSHMRVCFSDLAELVKAYGLGEAFRRYNGAGPAAEEYREACMGMMPWARELING